MRHLLTRLGVMSFLLLLFGFDPAVSSDATVEQAEGLFARGNFLAAAGLAAELDSAQGLALAARATLAHADFKAAPGERMGAVRLAERFARGALAKDPENVEALLHLSLAIGYRARQQGALAAHFQGLADEGKYYLDKAIALDPDNSWGYGMLGAWHMEIVRHAGNGLAGVVYDAGEEKGIALFEKALSLDPDNLLLNEEFAIALLAVDAGSYAELAAGHLRKALELTPRNELDVLAQARARTVLSAVSSGDEGKVVRLIESIRGELKPVNGIDRDRAFID